MRLLYKHTATLLRVDGVDTYDVKGNYVAPTRSEQEFKCVIHPPTMKSVYQNDLPEGITFADYREIRTSTPIYASNDRTKLNADHIIYNNIEYVTFIANPWSSPSDRIDHYEGVIVRKDFLEDTNGDNN